MLIIVKKKKMIQLIVDEGWYSAKEMKDDLKWTQTLVTKPRFVHQCAWSRGFQ